MGDPHDLINEIYREKKILIYGGYFDENFIFVTVILIILFKYLFDVFSP